MLSEPSLNPLPGQRWLDPWSLGVDPAHRYLAIDRETIKKPVLKTARSGIINVDREETETGKDDPMKKGNALAVADSLRTLFKVGGLGTLTDQELLERFVSGGDGSTEAAFIILIERHGPMVLRVCRGILNDRHDAEDAFQATFLLLLRKASSLWVHDSIGPWLHQVSLRVANKARGIAARQRDRKTRTIHSTASSSPEDQGEIVAIVQEEVGQLPEKYRVPVVLCYLQGHSHESAARSLNWPVGTVRGRLARARDLLKRRLIRRGFAPSALILGASTAQAVPYRLTLVLIHSVTEIRAGTLSGMVSAGVAQLMEDEGKTMIVTKLKMAGMTLLASGLLISAGAIARPDGDATPQTKTARPTEKPKTQESLFPLGIINVAHSDAKFFENDESERLFSMMVEAETASKLAEDQAEFVEPEKIALKALLKKYNYGVPKDFERVNQELSNEQAEIAAQCAKAKQRLEEIIKADVELRAKAGRGELAAVRLSKLHPELGLAGTQPPVQTPAPADHEKRLKDLENKFDRVLDALDHLKHEPRR